jgi:NADPH-dependent glutamate synthase beta subunit-like oxidoreductase
LSRSREEARQAGVRPELVHAPCESACPANVDIPGYISLVAEKRYAEALRLHREIVAREVRMIERMASLRRSPS